MVLGETDDLIDSAQEASPDIQTELEIPLMHVKQDYEPYPPWTHNIKMPC